METIEETLLRLLQGRLLLVDELMNGIAEAGCTEISRFELQSRLQALEESGFVEEHAGFIECTTKRGWLRGNRRVYQCLRCGNDQPAKQHWSMCLNCGQICPYCEECLMMGKIRACTKLWSKKVESSTRDTHMANSKASPSNLFKQSYYSKQLNKTRNAITPSQYNNSNNPRKSTNINHWSLSPPQEAASKQALAFIAARRNGEMHEGAVSQAFLIWAVTGAGKTEMIYPLIEDTLRHGGRVLIATPRRDVVLELAPRMKKAFPEQAVISLYGGSPDRWSQAPITIATTHQLLRMKHAAELVIIDELDAFPYHNNPMLQFAAARACAPGGAYVYLTATPPPALLRDARKGRIAHTRVPVRFHGHPLPEPQRIRMPRLARTLAAGANLPAALQQPLLRSLRRGAQVFLFVPRIEQVALLVQRLRLALPGLPVDGTSSVDPDRADKVRAFRARTIRVLVTTTILERGVTVPKSDVYILDADAGLFDAAALVQMAGRAGRSAEDPAGAVYFLAETWTSAQREALRQIRSMNKEAANRGYLRS